MFLKVFPVQFYFFDAVARLYLQWCGQNGPVLIMIVIEKIVPVIFTYPYQALYSDFLKNSVNIEP